MKLKSISWQWFLVGVFVFGIIFNSNSVQANPDNCTYTPNPTGWQYPYANVAYKLTADQTWVNVPTGHFVIAPTSVTWSGNGGIKVLINGDEAPLYSDRDLHNSIGTQYNYAPGDDGFEIWFHTGFTSNARIVLQHWETAYGTWTHEWEMNVSCPQDCPTPLAKFYANPTNGNSPLDVSFSNQSSGGVGESIIRYQWDFGDGYGSTSKNPSHKYRNPGTYTVKLTVRNSCGEEDAVQKMGMITVNQPISTPSADFSANTVLGDTPLTVQFYDRSQPGQGASMSKYSWTFGDGYGSTSINPSHTYREPGTYTVKLTVRNSFGEEDVMIKSDMITVNQPASIPIADFTADTVSGNAPLRVQFFNQSEPGQGAAIWEYYWDFGDGETSYSESPSHTFQNEGFYDVSLRVRNTFGKQDTETKSSYIEVKKAPEQNLPPFSDEWIPPSDGFDYPVGGEYKGRSEWRASWDFLDTRYNMNGYHPGEDWNLGAGTQDLGAPVRSVSNGKVVAIENNTNGYEGISVLILHNFYGIEYWSQYSHLRNVTVQEGDWVMRRQQIGEIGWHSGGPHLHFEMRDQNLGIHEWPSGRTPAQIEAMGYRNPTDAASPCWANTGCGSYSNQPGFIDDYRPDPSNVTELMEDYIRAGIIVSQNDHDVLNENYIDNRVNFITVLVRSLEILAGKNLSDAGDVDFVDVPSDAWFYPYVLKAYNIGLIDDTRPDQKFFPERAITRVEALAFTLRAYEYFIYSVTPHDSDAFLDVTPHTYEEWIYDIVQRGYAANLTEGYATDEGRVFYPMHWVIRMETVAFIDKLIVELENYGDIDGNGVVDMNDVVIIQYNLRSPVESCPECDVDGDGAITILDARKLYAIISGQ